MSIGSFEQWIDTKESRKQLIEEDSSNESWLRREYERQKEQIEREEHIKVISDKLKFKTVDDTRGFINTEGKFAPHSSSYKGPNIYRVIESEYLKLTGNTIQYDVTRRIMDQMGRNEQLELEAQRNAKEIKAEFLVFVFDISERYRVDIDWVISILTTMGEHQCE